MTVQPVEVTSLVERILDDLQCDHSLHHDDHEAHEGSAEWWVSFTCPGCGHVAEGFRCAGWRSFCVARSQSTHYISCPPCKYLTLMSVYVNQAKWVKL